MSKTTKTGFQSHAKEIIVKISVSEVISLSSGALYFEGGLYHHCLFSSVNVAHMILLGERFHTLIYWLSNSIAV